jgi:hypothetical protein
VPRSRYVILLDNGKIEVQGSSEDVIASGKLGDDVSRSRPSSVEASKMPSRVPSSIGNESGDTLIGEIEAANGDGDHSLSRAKSIDKAAKKDVKDAMQEKKAQGGVKWPVLILYLRSMGPWYVHPPEILITH